MNVFSFFATHPRLQCLSLGEKGCLANTFDILLWSRLSLCLSSKLKQLVLCQKVEQNCQTLFFYSCAKIPKSGHKCIGLQSHESLTSTICTLNSYTYTVGIIVTSLLRFFIDPCCNFSVLY